MGSHVAHHLAEIFFHVPVQGLGHIAQGLGQHHIAFNAQRGAQGQRAFTQYPKERIHSGACRQHHGRLLAGNGGQHAVDADTGIGLQGGQAQEALVGCRFGTDLRGCGQTWGRARLGGTGCSFAPLPACGGRQGPNAHHVARVTGQQFTQPGLLAGDVIDGRQHQLGNGERDLEHGGISGGTGGHYRHHEKNPPRRM